MIIIALKHYIFLLLISGKQFRYAHNLTRLPNSWETEWSKTNRKCDTNGKFLQSKQAMMALTIIKKREAKTFVPEKKSLSFELKVEV